MVCGENQIFDQFKCVCNNGFYYSNITEKCESKKIILINKNTKNIIWKKIKSK
jgi:hypothetical protein